MTVRSLSWQMSAIAAYSVAGLLVLMAPNVVAQDAPFTFDVDVDVKELHERVSNLHVRCAVYGNREGSTLGRGDTIQKVTEGAFKGAVRVAIKMADGTAPEDARRYACRLRLIVDGAAPAKPAPRSGDIALRPRRGPPFTPLLSGDL